MAKYKVLMLETAYAELQDANRMLRELSQPVPVVDTVTPALKAQADGLRQLKRQLTLLFACVVCVFVLELVQMVTR